MSGHRKIAEAGSKPSRAARPVTNFGERYISPAPLSDVMFEQLQYLAAHALETCPSDCPDCARFAQIKNWLLLPFNSSRPIDPAHASAITASATQE